MSLSREDLERVIETVWSTQLGFQLIAADPGQAESALDPENTVFAVVAFEGGFTGRLEQRCSPHVSLSAAAAAFAASGKEVGASDIQDTITEMAHMTAGNLKSLLPAGCRVTNVGRSAVASENDTTLARAGFTFEAEPLVVDVIQAG